MPNSVQPGCHKNKNRKVSVERNWSIIAGPCCQVAKARMITHAASHADRLDDGAVGAENRGAGSGQATTCWHWTQLPLDLDAVAAALSEPPVTRP